MNINTPMSIFQQLRTELKTEYGTRKGNSLKYSKQDTPFFLERIIEYRSCNDTRKAEIEYMFRKAKSQEKCSMNIEHILAAGFDSEGDTKTDKKILKNMRCRARKSCNLCAAIDGMKFVSKMLSYWEENEDLIAFPFTISPPNYTGSTLRARVINAHLSTEKLYSNFKDVIKKRKDGKNRGNEDSQLAIKQIKENMTALHMSKEFENGSYENGYSNSARQQGLILDKNGNKSKNKKDDFLCLLPSIGQHEKAHKKGKENLETVNCHFHGMMFMKVDKSGSWKETFNYESFIQMIKQANGGVQCQIEIGNTENRNRPITHREDATKAFLEIVKYIIKMPTKTTEDDFNRRQALIWEVSAITHRVNFIKQAGELVKYKIPQDISLWKPHTLQHHEMIYENEKYMEEVNDIDDEFITEAWFETISLEQTRYELDIQKEKLESINDSVKYKKKKIYIKGLETKTENLIAKIDYIKHCKRNQHSKRSDRAG